MVNLVKVINFSQYIYLFHHELLLYLVTLTQKYRRVLSNFNQTGHPQEIGHIIAIVRPQGVHLVAKFQANRPNGSVCAGPAVKSEMPVRAPAGGLTEILLSVNTPVPQQRGIWADLQNLTKRYAIWKPEVGE